MSELAKGVSKLICVIKVKAGEDGKMFGSVTAGMIADELKHQFDIALDKRKIHLEHPLRTTGEYEIELNLHAEVKGTLKVRVESLTPAPAPAPEALAAADAKAEKPRTEKRSYAKRDAEVEKPAKAEAAVEKKPHAAKAEKPAKAAKAPKAEKKEKSRRSGHKFKPRKILRGFFVLARAGVLPAAAAATKYRRANDPFLSLFPGRFPAQVFLSGGVNADGVTVGDEQRDHDLEAGFELRLLP